MAQCRLFLTDSTDEIKRTLGLLMARREKNILLFLLKFNSIHWEKNERQDRLEHLKVVVHSACLLEQVI